MSELKLRPPEKHKSFNKLKERKSSSERRKNGKGRGGGNEAGEPRTVRAGLIPRGRNPERQWAGASPAFPLPLPEKSIGEEKAKVNSRKRDRKSEI